jgi:phospholipid/cholesterol/gamma-HCH transport system substrate-binding protein
MLSSRHDTGRRRRSGEPARKRQRLVGLSVLVATIAVGWLALAKPDPFHHPHVVRAMFDHTQGIAIVQRDVRVAGVNVGTIGEVRRVGTHALVELQLHQDIPVYRDARAALRPHTPFEGTAFVDLEPGSEVAGRLGGAVIPLSHTSVFVSAGEVFSVFKAPVRRAFQTIVRELAHALERPGQEGLSAALHNAPVLLRDTALVGRALRGPHGDELRALVPSVAATVDALAGRNGQLAGAVADARRTLDAIAVDDAAPLDASLARLPGTLADAGAASRSIVGVLDRADVTAAALVPTLKAIPQTTRGAVALFGQANPVLAKLPPVIDDFAGSIRKLADAGPALQRLFAALVPAARLLQGSLVPFLQSKSAFGLPVYLQLMSSLTGLTGVLSGFVTAPQTGIATGAIGHGLRGSLQLPLTAPLPPSSLGVRCSTISTLNAQGAALAQLLGLCTP